MRDTRLTNMREALAEATRCCELQVIPLIGDCLRTIGQLEDENLLPHERIDLAQARSALAHASKSVHTAVDAMAAATKEIAELEGRGHE